VFDKSEGKTINFYRTRFDEGELAVLLRNQLTHDLSVTYGPEFNFFSIKREDNIGRIINYPSLNGLDSASLYRPKVYVGAQAGINIDNRNDDVIPTRGALWRTLVRYNQGIGKFSNNLTQATSDLSFYISTNDPAKLIFAFRFGGGVNFGNYQFFQAQFLSGTDNLRGFRKYRFGGDRMLYNNAEVRYKIKEFQTYLFPGAIGILAFHDIGRVWKKGESSKVWHRGYGAGVWLAPAKRAVFTASYTQSKDGPLPLVTFGFQF
jgi:outer membrane protein assembly factor BamA